MHALVCSTFELQREAVTVPSSTNVITDNPIFPVVSIRTDYLGQSLLPGERIANLWNALLYSIMYVYIIVRVSQI
jgi:hypothetical protein